MPWNSLSPIGNISVKANRTTMNQNTVYIETTMGNNAVGTNTATTRDHFWNVGSNEDGRHRFIQSPGFVVSPGSVPADAVLGTGMDSVLYSKLISVVEATSQVDVQPYFRNAKQIMRLLGIRAMGLFNGGASSPSQPNVKYSFNLKDQSIPGIKRAGQGLYEVLFDNALPSSNYLILGGCIRNSSTTTNTLEFFVQSAASVATVKDTTGFNFMTLSSGGESPHDPLQCWFVCFGG